MNHSTNTTPFDSFYANAQGTKIMLMESLVSNELEEQKATIEHCAGGLYSHFSDFTRGLTRYFESIHIKADVTSLAPLAESLAFIATDSSNKAKDTYQARELIKALIDINTMLIIEVNQLDKAITGGKHGHH